MEIDILRCCWGYSNQQASNSFSSVSFFSTFFLFSLKSNLETSLSDMMWFYPSIQYLSHHLISSYHILSLSQHPHVLSYIVSLIRRTAGWWRRKKWKLLSPPLPSAHATPHTPGTYVCTYQHLTLFLQKSYPIIYRLWERKSGKNLMSSVLKNITIISQNNTTATLIILWLSLINEISPYQK